MKHRVSCAGKQSFATKSEADRIARLGRQRHDCALRAYRCDTCRAYHVGAPARVRRRPKGKDIEE